MNKSEIAGNQNDINYIVVFSRRRTIGISIHPKNGVVIRAPYRTPSRIIEEVIQGKKNWIRKHQERFLKLENSTLPVSYSDNSIHFFKGNSYFLKTLRSEKGYTNLHENLIEIGLTNPTSESVIKRALYLWYKTEAMLYFTLKMKEVLLKFDSYNFKPSSMVVRTMKRRWGSCSVKGKITLNTELIRMTAPCIEYVIIHELCHLKHHNHGKEFYALMSEISPDWKLHKRKLKDHIM